MPDFAQFGSITTLHEFGTADPRELESILTSASESCKIGLILPSTAADMRAEPFSRIVDRLRDAEFVDSIVVALGVRTERSRLPANQGDCPRPGQSC